MTLEFGLVIGNVALHYGIRSCSCVWSGANACEGRVAVFRTVNRVGERSGIELGGQLAERYEGTSHDLQL